MSFLVQMLASVFMDLRNFLVFFSIFVGTFSVFMSILKSHPTDLQLQSLILGHNDGLSTSDLERGPLAAEDE